MTERKTVDLQPIDVADLLKSGDVSYGDGQPPQSAPPNDNSTVGAAPTPDPEVSGPALDRTVSPPEPPKKTDVLEETLTSSVIERLSERFKLSSEKTFDLILLSGGGEVSVSARKPTYDDYMWVTGAIESLRERNEPLVSGAVQTKQFMKHLIYCKCVTKIEGEYVWDIFGWSTEIKKDDPLWDGKSYTGIPHRISAEIAFQVQGVLRRLDPDILFSLERQMDEICEPDQAAGNDGPDPTKAA